MRQEASPRAVLAARKQFFQLGLQDRPLAALVPEPILRSWKRCAERGLDSAALPRLEPLTAHELSAIAERHERLRRLVPAGNPRACMPTRCRPAAWSSSPTPRG